MSGVKMDQELRVCDLLSAKLDIIEGKLKFLKQGNETLEAELKVLCAQMDVKASMASCSFTVDDLTGTKTTSRNQTTLNVEHFQTNLRRNNSETEPRTSSPVDFRSLVESSMFAYANDQTKLESSQIDFPPEDQKRLLGELAYQLDKRILSYVFQAQKRFYGFTVLNIHHKINDMSTHPLTGRVDEGYRFYLSLRHEQLMAKLQQVGFKPQLHPHFTEFVINTYGILKRSPAEYVSTEADLNDPDFLKRVILSIAPTNLQKDLLVVLSCLSSMADRDQKPLFIWSSRMLQVAQRDMDFPSTSQRL